jgi:hypothetical protein
MATVKEYRALVGIDFTDTSGEPARVEAGDKIVGMPEDELRHQMNAGNAEVWRSGKTENVFDFSGVEVEVSGVLSRHRDGQIVLTDAAEKAEERGDV